MSSTQSETLKDRLDELEMLLYKLKEDSELQLRLYYADRRYTRDCIAALENHLNLSREELTALYAGVVNTPERIAAANWSSRNPL